VFGIEGIVTGLLVSEQMCLIDALGFDLVQALGIDLAATDFGVFREFIGGSC